MRTICAALFGASAALPLLAHAVWPDPADASASIPAVGASSAFDDYKPYRDSEGPSWQQLNRAVAPAQPANGANSANRSQRAGAASAAAGGHRHGGEPE
ncbi:hypothetical protein PQQ88_23005 [Paraburkholderia caledonica]|jgi:hypothetical protein|uniref:hypothetical protein n=1 Tax=Paraburkholderia caledonica TaxID=134536 RepID=UPI0038B86ABA